MHVQVDATAICDEHRRYAKINGNAIHIDSRAQRQNKICYAFADAKFVGTSGINR